MLAVNHRSSHVAPIFQPSRIKSNWWGHPSTAASSGAQGRSGQRCRLGFRQCRFECWRCCASRFIGMAAPVSDAQRATTWTTASVKVSYANGRTQTQALGYNTLYKTGDSLKNGHASVLAGGYFDQAGAPIMDTSGAVPMPYFSDSPDGQSLLSLPHPTVPDIKGNTVFLVTQFEYLSANNASAGVRPTPSASEMYGKLPAQIAVAT